MTNRTLITIRLPKELLDQLDALVLKLSPLYRNRSHAVEVAITKLLEEK